MNLDLIKKMPRQQQLIAVGAVIVVLAGLFLWLLFGSLAKLGPDPEVPGFLRTSGGPTSLFAQIAAKERQITEQNTIAQRMEEKQTLLNGMRSDIEVARKRLPSDAQKAEMRQLIEDLGRQVGSSVGELVIKSVSIREASSSKAGGKDEVKTVEYMTQLTATTDSLIQFINLIERNQRFMTVDSIQLTSGGISPDPKADKVSTKPHSVSLRIVTYIDTSGSQPAGKK